MKERGLTPKQARFVDEYLKDLPVGLLLGEDVEVIKNMIFEQMRNS